MQMKIEFLKNVKAMKKTAKIGEIWDVPDVEAYHLVGIRAAKFIESKIEPVEAPVIEPKKKGKKK